MCELRSLSRFSRLATHADFALLPLTQVAFLGVFVAVMNALSECPLPRPGCRSAFPNSLFRFCFAVLWQSTTFRCARCCSRSRSTSATFPSSVRLAARCLLAPRHTPLQQSWPVHAAGTIFGQKWLAVQALLKKAQANGKLAWDSADSFAIGGQPQRQSNNRALMSPSCARND